MPPTMFILVTAPEGRLCPIASEDGREPNGSQLRVGFGKIRRVKWSPAIRRAIADHDLFMCNMDGARVESVALAAAPDDFPHDGIAVKAKPEKGGVA